MSFLAWTILFLPLFAAVAITLFTLKNRDLSARLSISAIVLGFILSLVLLLVNGGEREPDVLVPWLSEICTSILGSGWTR